jgi:hypothetical protein
MLIDEGHEWTGCRTVYSVCLAGEQAPRRRRAQTIDGTFVPCGRTRSRSSVPRRLGLSSQSGGPVDLIILRGLTQAFLKEFRGTQA